MIEYIKKIKRICTAHHEAGHIVAYLYFGHPVFKVTLRPELYNNSKNSLGFVETLVEKDYYKLKNLIDLRKLSHEFLISVSAGWEAEKIFNPELRDKWGKIDIKNLSLAYLESLFIKEGNEMEVFYIAKKYSDLKEYGWDCEPPFDELKIKAKFILRKHWLDIRTLTGSLLRKNKLVEEDIKNLIPNLYSKTEENNSVKKIWQEAIFTKSLLAKKN